MSIIFVILAVLAAAASAAGTAVAAQSQKRAAQYNEDVNKKNAETASQQAAFDAQTIRDRNKRLLATQRANYAASGIDPDSGTAIDVQRDSAAQGEIDALTAIYTGQSSANASLARASLNRMEARAARTSGTIGVTSSLLGSASSGVYNYSANPNF